MICSPVSSSTYGAVKMCIRDRIYKTHFFLRAELFHTVVDKVLQYRCIIGTDCHDQMCIRDSTGLFPEQAVNWDWFSDKIRSAKRPVKVLNLNGFSWNVREP